MSLFAPYTLVFASGLRCASYILEGQLALTGRAFIHISSVDSRHDGTNRPCAQVPPQSSFTRAASRMAFPAAGCKIRNE